MWWRKCGFSNGCPSSTSPVDCCSSLRLSPVAVTHTTGARNLLSTLWRRVLCVTRTMAEMLTLSPSPHKLLHPTNYSTSPPSSDTTARNHSTTCSNTPHVLQPNHAARKPKRKTVSFGQFKITKPMQKWYNNKNINSQSN